LIHLSYNCYSRRTFSC